MVRWLLGLILIAALAAGGAYLVAGRAAPPRLVIDKPERLVGQSGTLEVSAETPDARFTTLTVALEQDGRAIPLFALGSPDAAGMMTQTGDRVRIARPLGRQSVPELRSGPAKIVVTATRSSFLNLRRVGATVTKDIQVRLEPPRIAVVSTHHYVNHGGSELVVYRVTPPEVASGVRVGDVEYPGFPASGAGVAGADAGAKAAFFSLLYDQKLDTRIEAFARDEAGNEARAAFVDKVFPKPFKQSRIELDDRFIGRVVPEILQHSPEIQAGGDHLASFLKINGELRKLNNDRIAAMAAKTSPSRLWKDPFVQLGNSQVEASFADHRTYLYNGKEVDRQVHLGFDLAVTSRIAVAAANAGTVLDASFLGIYGSCIVIDHGMGVQSLYGHLSSFEVKAGDAVARGQTIGRSGMTGLAGGDHLHFTMLVGGRMVNPVEWWDPHWIADRVERKLTGAPVQ